MSGKLNFILGRADTGKTARVVASLRAHQQNGERAILLVPEQYTYEAERLLAESLGGLLGVQVFSLNRLTERVLSLSGKTRPFLSAEGHRMVIRRAIDLRKNELKLFSRAAESGTSCRLSFISALSCNPRPGSGISQPSRRWSGASSRSK